MDKSGVTTPDSLKRFFEREVEVSSHHLTARVIDDPSHPFGKEMLGSERANNILQSRSCSPSSVSGARAVFEANNYKRTQIKKCNHC